MNYLELAVEQREKLGSSAVRRMRQNGKIPAVAYAGGEAATPLLLDGHEFMMQARGCPPAQLFKLKCAGSELDGQLAMVREVQQEPVKSKLLHVDLLLITEGVRITVSVPVTLEGEPKAVKEGRGIINQTTYELELECFPRKIPKDVTVNISGLAEGDSIHAGQLRLPQGAALVTPEEISIVSIVTPTSVVEPEEVAEEGEEAAAAEGEAAEGEAAEGEEAEGGEGEKSGGAEEGKE